MNATQAAIRAGYSFSKDAAYYFATPTAKAGSEPLQLFSDWLFKKTSAPTTNRFRIDSD